MRKSLTLLLALLGLFDSLYLLWVYTSPSHPMVCFGSSSGCDAVRMSIYSHVGRLPMPALGVVGYLAIALLIVAESLVPAGWSGELRSALVGATGFGFLYSIYLEYLQGFVIHHFCAWCVTSGVVMALLFLLALYDLFRPANASDVPTRMALRRAYLAVGALAVIFGIPAFYELKAHGEVPPPPPPPANASTADRLVRPDSHMFGNPNAAVTVVEFGDFECPLCGRTEPVAKQIREKYKERIRFVFRQFPLIHTHKFSERMAEASECAADQGEFWEAADQIYSHQDDTTDDGLKRDAAAIGLDPSKFNQCMASGAEAARVKRDMEDGRALGVDATPTVYVNGRVAEDVWDFDAFAHDIDEALAAVGKGTSPEAPGVSTKNSPPSPNSQHSSTQQGSTDSSTGFGLLGGGSSSIFSSSGVTCSEHDAEMKQPAEIDSAQLKGLLPSKPLFVDVRSAKEFAAGQIPGAVNIPIDDMPKRWDSLPKNRVIVFYESGRASGDDICASGRAAGRILLQHGYPFDHVRIYRNGLAGWQSVHLELAK